MDWRKTLILITAILFIPAASALSIDSIDLSLSQNWYTSNVSVNVTIQTDKGPASVSATFNGSSLNVTQGSDNTTYTTSLTIPTGEANLSLDVSASGTFNGSNESETDSASKPIQVDTEDPVIVDDSWGVNVSNATLDEEVKVNVTVTDGFMKNVTVGNKSIATGSLPVSMDRVGTGDVWEVFATPEDLGCGIGTCDLKIAAFDEAGNDAFIDDVSALNLTVLDGSQETETGFQIDILSPQNESLQDNSILDFELEVNATSVPDEEELFCEYQLRDADSGNPLAFEGYTREDFAGNVIGNLSLNDRILVEEDDNYDLTVTCYDNEGGEHVRSSSFAVLDTTPPSVNIEVSDITNTTVNVSLNATEEFRIDSFEYRPVEEDNISTLPTSDNFASEFGFQITGLKHSTEYVLKVEGTDRKEDEDRTDFSTTENFATEGFERNDTENETDIYQRLQDMNGTQRDFDKQYLVGQNASRVFSSLTTEGETSFTVRNFDMNLRSMSIAVREDIRNVQLKMITSQEEPGWIDTPRPSNSSVFEYYDIQAQNAPDDKLKYVKIEFEVEQLWLEEEGMDRSDLALFRYKDGEWDQLPTTLIKEGALLHRYEALTPGFSIFAVAAKKGGQKSVEEAVADIESGREEENESQMNTVETASESENEGESESPWYLWVIGVLIGLIALLGVYYTVVNLRQGGREEAEEFEDHTVVKAHMERLEKFVEEALAKGHSKSELKERLVDNGWDEKLVEFVLRRK